MKTQPPLPEIKIKTVIVTTVTMRVGIINRRASLFGHVARYDAARQVLCLQTNISTSVIFVTKIKTRTRIIGRRFQRTRTRIIVIQKTNTK